MSQSNADTINQYNFRAESIDNKIYITDTKKTQDINAVSEFSMKDSIFDMYPTAYYTYVDATGNLYSQSCFVEREKFELEISTFQSRSSLKHTFMWASNKLINIERDKNVNGYVMDSFVSYYKFYEFSDVKTFPSFSPDEVAMSLILQMGVPPAKPFVTPCKNRRNWHQGGRRASVFIRDILRTHAVSRQDNSPFLSFFNLKGEFHFRSLKSLYNNNPPAPPPINSPSVTPIKYTIDFTKSDFQTSLSYVQDVIDFTYVGSEVNLDKYATLFTYHLGNKYDTDEKLFKDYMVNTNNKYPLRHISSFPRKPNIAYHLNIYSEDDKDSLEGKINSYYINILMPVRMRICVYFNPELVAGRLIEIVSYIDEKNKKNPLISGDWLILESQHSFSNDSISTKAVFTTLELAKPDLTIEDKERVLQVT
jgi:hypothetical protein